MLNVAAFDNSISDVFLFCRLLQHRESVVGNPSRKVSGAKQSEWVEECIDEVNI